MTSETRRATALAGLLLVAAGVAGACASFDSAPDAPVPTTDASTDGPEDAAIDGASAEAGPSADAGDAATCTPAYATDGLLVILASAGDPCPAESAAITLKADPVALGGACSCASCSPLTNPACASAGRVVGYGDTTACSEGSESFSLQDNTCVSAGGTFDISPYNRWPAQTPSAGSCSAAKVTDVGKTTATKLRACAPSTPSAICSAIASGNRLCIPRNEDGGGECAAPFTTALVAGDDVALSCGDCTCSRTSTKCVVEYHGNAGCTDLKATLDLDGTCSATGAPQDVTHFKLHPTTPSCVTIPGAASVSLTNRRELCCTP